MDEQEFTPYEKPITISCGSTIEIWATQEADGYSFQNWSYKYEGNTQTSSENPITITPITDNCILTPVYKLKECTITIESNDGNKYTGTYYKGNTEPLKYKTGEAIQVVYNESITIQPYEREGYHFVKWDYKPKDDNYVRTDANGNLIISPITTSYVITPQYEINTYSVNILKPDNINTTCSVNVKVNNTEYNNQSLPYTKSGIEHGSNVIVSIVNNEINGYSFQRWSGDVSSNVSSFTISNIQDNYEVTPVYQQMVKLTVQKPDYVSGYTINYSSNNENGTIVFGDNNQIEKTFPKDTSITVTASTATRDSTNNIPCGGWEINEQFYAPDTNPNVWVINTLSTDTTIKPIYYYKVELSLYPLKGIYNEVASSPNIYITQSSLSGETGIPDSFYENQTAYGGNTLSECYPIPSITYYPPNTKVQCVFSGDGDWDLDSWWSATELQDNSTTEYKIPSNINNCLKPVRERIYTIPSLEKDMTIYGYPAKYNLAICGFGLGYNNYNINQPSINRIFYYRDVPGTVVDTRVDNSNKFNMREDYAGYRQEGQEWDWYWGIRANLFDNNWDRRPEGFPFYYSNKSAFPLTLTISYTPDNNNNNNNNNITVITDCRLVCLRSNPLDDQELDFGYTQWQAQVSQGGTTEYRTKVIIDLSDKQYLDSSDRWHLSISLLLPDSNQ